MAEPGADAPESAAPIQRTGAATPVVAATPPPATAGDATLPADVELLFTRRIASFAVLRACVQGQAYFMDCVLLPPGASVQAHTHTHDSTRDAVAPHALVASTYALLLGFGRIASLTEPLDILAAAFRLTLEYEHACLHTHGVAALSASIAHTLTGVAGLLGGRVPPPGAPLVTPEEDEMPDFLPSVAARARPRKAAAAPPQSHTHTHTHTHTQARGITHAQLAMLTNPHVHMAGGSPVYSLLPIHAVSAFRSLGYARVFASCLCAAAHTYTHTLAAAARVLRAVQDAALRTALLEQLRRFDRRVKHHLVKPLTLALAASSLAIVHTRTHTRSWAQEAAGSVAAPVQTGASSVAADAASEPSHGSGGVESAVDDASVCESVRVCETAQGSNGKLAVDGPSSAEPVRTSLCWMQRMHRSAAGLRVMLQRTSVRSSSRVAAHEMAAIAALVP